MMDGIERIKVLAAEVEDKQVRKIVNYLVSREDMNEKYLNEEKSLKQMLKFIGNEIMKNFKLMDIGNNAKMVCTEDEEIYSLAIHYWDESNNDLGIKSKEKLDQEIEEIKLHNAEQVKLRKEQLKNQKEVPKKKEWVPEGQLSLF